MCSGRSFPSLTVRTCSNESSLPSFDNPYTTCEPSGDARHQSSEKWLDPPGSRTLSELLSLVGSTRTRSCPASRTKSLKLSAPSGRCWKNNFPPADRFARNQNRKTRTKRQGHHVQGVSKILWCRVNCRSGPCCNSSFLIPTFFVFACHAEAPRKRQNESRAKPKLPPVTIHQIYCDYF